MVSKVIDLLDATLGAICRVTLWRASCCVSASLRPLNFTRSLVAREFIHWQWMIEEGSDDLITSYLPSCPFCLRYPSFTAPDCKRFRVSAHLDSQYSALLSEGGELIEMRWEPGRGGGREGGGRRGVPLCVLRCLHSKASCVSSLRSFPLLLSTSSPCFLPVFLPLITPGFLDLLTLEYVYLSKFDCRVVHPAPRVTRRTVRLQAKQRRIKWQHNRMP